MTLMKKSRSSERRKTSHTSEVVFREWPTFLSKLKPSCLPLVFTSFIDEDPGRQSISGSFNPIDVGEWSGQVYIGQTEKFFAAIAAQDRAMVASILKAGMDVNRRDHVGRTPLHVAIISNSAGIACDLIDAGARMTARLVDGRTPLHIAAQKDQLFVIRKLFERSAVNAEQAKKDGKKGTQDDATHQLATESDRQSSQDDWSSNDADGIEDLDNEGELVDENPGTASDVNGLTAMTDPPAPTPADVDDIPEDEADQPDVVDVNLADWDFAFTPLMYAVLFSSLPVVEEILTAGGDPKLVTKANGYAPPFNPLSLSVLTDDDDRPIKIVERLLVAGVSSSASDTNGFTIFHHAVAQGNAQVVSTLLRCDPNANAVLNFPALTWDSAIFPIVTAISNGNYSMLALMLAHGVKVLITEEDISRAHAAW